MSSDEDSDDDLLRGGLRPRRACVRKNDQESRQKMQQRQSLLESLKQSDQHLRSKSLQERIKRMADFDPDKVREEAERKAKVSKATTRQDMEDALDGSNEFYNDDFLDRIIVKKRVQALDREGSVTLGLQRTISISHSYHMSKQPIEPTFLKTYQCFEDAVCDGRTIIHRLLRTVKRINVDGSSTEAECVDHESPSKKQRLSELQGNTSESPLSPLVVDVVTNFLAKNCFLQILRWSQSPRVVHVSNNYLKKCFTSAVQDLICWLYRVAVSAGLDSDELLALSKDATRTLMQVLEMVDTPFKPSSKIFPFKEMIQVAFSDQRQGHLFLALSRSLKPFTGDGDNADSSKNEADQGSKTVSFGSNVAGLRNLLDLWHHICLYIPETLSQGDLPSATEVLVSLFRILMDERVSSRSVAFSITSRLKTLMAKIVQAVDSDCATNGSNQHIWMKSTAKAIFDDFERFDDREFDRCEDGHIESWLLSLPLAVRRFPLLDRDGRLSLPLKRFKSILGQEAVKRCLHVESVNDILSQVSIKNCPEVLLSEDSAWDPCWGALCSACAAFVRLCGSISQMDADWCLATVDCAILCFQAGLSFVGDKRSHACRDDEFDEKERAKRMLAMVDVCRTYSQPVHVFVSKHHTDPYFRRADFEIGIFGKYLDSSAQYLASKAGEGPRTVVQMTVAQYFAESP